MNWLYSKEVMLPQSNERNFINAYENYRQPIYEVVCTFMKDKQAAEDIVQDVFLKLWVKRDHIDSINDLQAFLWVAARNQCINVIRQQKCISFIPLQAAKDKVNGEGPAEIIIRKETARLLQCAIQSLPAQRKNIFMLNWCEGWNKKQIADHLQISTFTVKASLQSARRDIRLFMTRHTHLKRKNVLQKLKKLWQNENLKQVA